MLMNNNTISFNSFEIEVPKIDKDQYILLRLLLVAIEEKQIKSGQYFISISSFPKEIKKRLSPLLEENIKIKVVNKASGSLCFFYVVNDIELTKEDFLFTPAKIIREIIEESHTNNKRAFLKYILFHGIRSKSTLLFLDYLLKRDEAFFEISIKELRKVFEIKDKYKNFNSLKKHVIERAINEINENTNIKVGFEITQREGRKITDLSFTYFSKDIN